LWDAKNVELINTADENVNWLYTVFVKKGKSRDELARVLQEAGVETNVAHVRNDLFTVFGGKRQRLDGMNMIEKRYLCLPLNNAIDEKDVRHVCRVIREAKL
jgi:dTDP-4-amino-4,6-dideoxygalactose transaminase